uniref:Uncharacterized protein n=1 Tax=Knipowitschia caucasica TaxID=637954 RepID=A0AAV2KFV2_KNICA
MWNEDTFLLRSQDAGDLELVSGVPAGPSCPQPGMEMSDWDKQLQYEERNNTTAMVDMGCELDGKWRGVKRGYPWVRRHATRLNHRAAEVFPMSAPERPAGR